MRSRWIVFGLVSALLSLGAARGRSPGHDRPATEIPAGSAAMSFARIEYDSTGGMNEAYYYYEGRVWQRWETDFPQADSNFLYRLEQLTTSQPHPKPITLRIEDEDLYDFPLLYMCDPGWMELDEPEIERLRDYLLKGGFLWIDDFWGLAEWKNVERVFSAVLPGRTWQEIPRGHPIFSNVYELDGVPQVPARDFAWLGHDPPEIHRYPVDSVTPAHMRGYFNDDGRLMVLATHNTDIGDGWEREAYGEWYFEKYSTVAYAIGVNIVVYALSH